MKIYVPTINMRTSPLSKTPGGKTVTVFFETHEIVYTNIKAPRSYIDRIPKEGVVKIEADGQLIWPLPTKK
jgi:hypothetical protein